MRIGIIRAVNRTTNDDIRHHCQIVTKAYCLGQVQFGSRWQNFLTFFFPSRVIGRQKIRQTPMYNSDWAGMNSYQFLINCNKLCVLSWFLCQSQCWCACRPGKKNKLWLQAKHKAPKVHKWQRNYTNKLSSGNADDLGGGGGMGVQWKGSDKEGIPPATY